MRHVWLAAQEAAATYAPAREHCKCCSLHTQLSMRKLTALCFPCAQSARVCPVICRTWRRRHRKLTPSESRIRLTAVARERCSFVGEREKCGMAPENGNCFGCVVDMRVDMLRIVRRTVNAPGQIQSHNTGNTHMHLARSHVSFSLEG